MSTEETPTCQLCQQVIDDAEYVVVGSNNIHPACFNCATCSTSICSIPYCTKDNKYYCEACYFEQFGNRCANCNEFLRGGFISALGKQWHRECFVCLECGQPFTGNRFRKYDGKPYCEEDFKRLFATFCAKCNQEIEGQVFSAIGKNFHLDCFRCGGDSHTIGEGVEFYMNENVPFCMEHFLERFGKRCQRCNQVIAEEYIKVGQTSERLWHVNCFMCSECGVNLSDAMWFVENDQLLCQADHTRLFPQGEPNIDPETKRQNLLRALQNDNSAPPPAATAEAPPVPTQDPEPAPAKSSVEETAVESANSYSSQSTTTAHISPNSPATFETQEEPEEDGKEASPTPEPADSNQSDQVFYPYEQLKSVLYCPAQVPAHRREAFLSDQEFERVFSMNKEKFYALPKWRQMDCKKRAQLF